MFLWFLNCVEQSTGKVAKQLQKEALAVKSILQGSSKRSHQQRPPHPLPTPADASHPAATPAKAHSDKTSPNQVSSPSTNADTKTNSTNTTPKKRSIFEVLKNPSNAKVPDKNAAQAPNTHHHHQAPPRKLDKVEIEFLEALQVWTWNKTTICQSQYHSLRPQQLKIPDAAKKELKRWIQMLDSVIHKKYATENIDEVSECVQNSYTRLVDLMNGKDTHFVNVSSECHESVVDFFEKVVMTQNHKWVRKDHIEFLCPWKIHFIYVSSRPPEFSSRLRSPTTRIATRPSTNASANWAGSTPSICYAASTRWMPRFAIWCTIRYLNWSPSTRFRRPRRSWTASSGVVAVFSSCWSKPPPGQRVPMNSCRRWSSSCWRRIRCDCTVISIILRDLAMRRDWWAARVDTILRIWWVI